MAQVADYASLVSYITDLYDRASDTAFTGRIDTFIGLAEDSWTPTLQNRRMEATTTLTTASDGSVALPSDFYRLRALYGSVNGIQTNIPMIGPVAEQGIYPVSTGDPVSYARLMGSTLYVVPEQVQAVTLDYWQQFVGLSASNTTNWIITNFSSLYLYSVMAQAELWLQNWSNAASLDTKADSVLDGINDKFGQDYYNNTDLVLDTPTP